MADIWGEVCDYLAASLAGADLLAQVQVVDGMPGEHDQVGNELIVVDDEITSELSLPVGVGGAKPYDDRFEVMVLVYLKGRATRSEARDRLAEITGSVVEVLAADPTLGAIDGVLSAQIVRQRRIVKNTTDGPQAYGELVVSVHSRIVP